MTIGCLLLLGVGRALTAADLKPADLEFFEARIRPVLVAECYECHDAKKQKGDLRLDYRDGLLKGGEEGPSIVPGDAKRSLLIQSLTHEHATLQMPKKRPKLDAQIIADFTEWVNRGAPDPRDRAPTDSTPPVWSDLLTVRKSWWSFQPIAKPAVPAGRAASPIDRFLDAKIAAAGITPAAPTDQATLLRRATFVLTGLPPTAEELADFAADNSPEAFAKVVDRLLASPRFGEHFARHWMDLVRYADTHGSEGDPAIPQSWRYRDYLIRAFNTDVPYDQFVREQLAGDLLPTPRINTAENLNESALGPGHFRMIEHGFQPVDTVEEQVRNVDNQIDVVTKTFLGLTVSCARCHDHKFDAISQADFYALYGVFASARPGQVTVDSPALLGKKREQLVDLKQALRTALAAEWRRQSQALPSVWEHLRSVATERAELTARLTSLEGATRAAAFRQGLRNPSVAGPTPSHAWTFEGDGRDRLGGLDARLLGGAVIRQGRLVLDGDKAFAETGILADSLGAKTLETWVALPTLDQRGGGVVAVETTGGAVFDAIVFAEKQPAKWLAGSDNGVRSRNVEGPVESARPEDLVHIAIVYQPDGHIELYRNGQPYGASYAPTGERGALRTFAKGQAHLLFGRRHTGGANAFLRGEIEEARVYDHALSGAEIRASFAAGPARGEGAAPDFATVAPSAEIASLRARLAALPTATSLEAALGDDQTGDHPLRYLGLKANGLRPVPAKAEAPWDLSGAGADGWFRAGNGLGPRHTPGDFRVSEEGPAVLREVLPSGLHSHTLSSRHSATLTSPRFRVSTDFVSVQVMGKGATLRLIPDNYPLSPGGSRFPKATVDAEQPTWITLDTAYRKGSFAYLELTLPADSTHPDGNPSQTGWYGVRQVIMHMTRESGPKGPALVVAAPGFVDVAHAARAMDAAAEAWGRDEADEAQAALLDAALRHGLLSARADLSSRITALVTEYRHLVVTEVATPRRAPGLLEAAGFDQPLYVRGDHRQPAGVVPRRYLEAFDARPFAAKGSGRLELAERIASADNPLTARVMVNRLWHHVFGRGLVGTVDNFGRLGDQPTHPELLDHLARRLVEQGWSVKALLRDLLLTDAFRRSSVPTASATEKDADNALLARMRVRRLEGEALRDTLLALAGKLESRMYGPGDNALAGPDEQRRRSVYLTIRRNALHPLITTFDGPKPFTTVGRRDATNVPAQSLTLLNDAFVVATARRWAATLGPNQADAAKVDALFRQALARPASPTEQAAATRYLADLRAMRRDDPTRVWADFAQSVLNLKEFLYLK
jgi:hypothetical protein